MDNYYFYLILHLRKSVTAVGKAKHCMPVKEDFPQENFTELQIAKLFTFKAQIIKTSNTVVYCLSLKEKLNY